MLWELVIAAGKGADYVSVYHIERPVCWFEVILQEPRLVTEHYRWIRLDYRRDNEDYQTIVIDGERVKIPEVVFKDGERVTFRAYVDGRRSRIRVGLSIRYIDEMNMKPWVCDTIIEKQEDQKALEDDATIDEQEGRTGGRNLVMREELRDISMIEKQEDRVDHAMIDEQEDYKEFADSSMLENQEGRAGGEQEHQEELATSWMIEKKEERAGDVQDLDDSSMIRELPVDGSITLKLRVHPSILVPQMQQDVETSAVRGREEDNAESIIKRQVKQGEIVDHFLVEGKQGNVSIIDESLKNEHSKGYAHVDYVLQLPQKCKEANNDIETEFMRTHLQLKTDGKQNILKEKIKINRSLNGEMAQKVGNINLGTELLADAKMAKELEDSELHLEQMLLTFQVEKLENCVKEFLSVDLGNSLKLFLNGGEQWRNADGHIVCENGLKQPRNFGKYKLEAEQWMMLLERSQNMMEKLCRKVNDFVQGNIHIMQLIKQFVLKVEKVDDTHEAEIGTNQPKKKCEMPASEIQQVVQEFAELNPNISTRLQEDDKSAINLKQFTCKQVDTTRKLHIMSELTEVKDLELDIITRLLGFNQMANCNTEHLRQSEIKNGNEKQQREKLINDEAQMMLVDNQQVLPKRGMSDICDKQHLMDIIKTGSIAKCILAERMSRDEDQLRLRATQEFKNTNKIELLESEKPENDKTHLFIDPIECPIVDESETTKVVSCDVSVEPEKSKCDDDKDTLLLWGTAEDNIHDALVSWDTLNDYIALMVDRIGCKDMEWEKLVNSGHDKTEEIEDLQRLVNDCKDVSTVLGKSQISSGILMMQESKKSLNVDEVAIVCEKLVNDDIQVTKVLHVSKNDEIPIIWKNTEDDDQDCQLSEQVKSDADDVAEDKGVSHNLENDGDDLFRVWQNLENEGVQVTQVSKKSTKGVNGVDMVEEKSGNSNIQVMKRYMNSKNDNEAVIVCGKSENDDVQVTEISKKLGNDGDLAIVWDKSKHDDLQLTHESTNSENIAGEISTNDKHTTRNKPKKSKELSSIKNNDEQPILASEKSDTDGRPLSAEMENTISVAKPMTVDEKQPLLLHPKKGRRGRRSKKSKLDEKQLLLDNEESANGENQVSTEIEQAANVTKHSMSENGGQLLEGDTTENGITEETSHREEVSVGMSWEWEISVEGERSDLSNELGHALQKPKIPESLPCFKKTELKADGSLRIKVETLRDNFKQMATELYEMKKRQYQCSNIPENVKTEVKQILAKTTNSKSCDTDLTEKHEQLNNVDTSENIAGEISTNDKHTTSNKPKKSKELSSIKNNTEQPILASKKSDNDGRPLSAEMENTISVAKQMTVDEKQPLLLRPKKGRRGRRSKKSKLDEKQLLLDNEESANGEKQVSTEIEQAANVTNHSMSENGGQLLEGDTTENGITEETSHREEVSVGMSWEWEISVEGERSDLSNELGHALQKPNIPESLPCFKKTELKADGSLSIKFETLLDNFKQMASELYEMKKRQYQCSNIPENVKTQVKQILAKITNSTSCDTDLTEKHEQLNNVDTSENIAGEISTNDKHTSNKPKKSKELSSIKNNGEQPILASEQSDTDGRPLSAEMENTISVAKQMTVDEKQPLLLRPKKGRRGRRSKKSKLDEKQLILDNEESANGEKQVSTEIEQAANVTKHSMSENGGQLLEGDKTENGITEETSHREEDSVGMSGEWEISVEGERSELRNELGHALQKPKIPESLPCFKKTELKADGSLRIKVETLRDNFKQMATELYEMKKLQYESSNIPENVKTEVKQILAKITNSKSCDTDLTVKHEQLNNVDTSENIAGEISTNDKHTTSNKPKKSKKLNSIKNNDEQPILASEKSDTDGRPLSAEMENTISVAKQMTVDEKQPLLLRPKKGRRERRSKKSKLDEIQLLLDNEKSENVNTELGSKSKMPKNHECSSKSTQNLPKSEPVLNTLMRQFLDEENKCKHSKNETKCSKKCTTHHTPKVKEIYQKFRENDGSLKEPGVPSGKLERKVETLENKKSESEETNINFDLRIKNLEDVEEIIKTFKKTTDDSGNEIQQLRQEFDNLEMSFLTGAAGST